MSAVVVRYQTKPERSGENQALIERVFAELNEVHPDALRYASFRLTDGSFSDGFRTNVFPHANAGAHIHIGTIAGKLNGVIPATTPSGWRSE